MNEVSTSLIHWLGDELISGPIRKLKLINRWVNEIINQEIE